MGKYRDTAGGPGPVIIILIILAALVPLAILLGPQLLQSVLSGIPQFPPQVPLPEIPPAGSNATQALPEDAQRYYSLKELSCGTLSKNFLIVADDVSAGSVGGLIAEIPEELDVAEAIVKENDYNQTTKTYVRGIQMKKVFISGNRTHTTIWKDGRVYQCSPSCTMNLLGDAGWQSYLEGLEKMRSGCAHFGRTGLPASVNITKLLRFEHTGRKLIGGFQCENFLVFANKTYASSLMNSTALNEDQRTLLWGLAHLEGPVEECLDDGIGIIVYRSITLDLKDSYKFDFGPGGYMRVKSETRLTYFTDNVPESFLALPG
jgi:hypothetical protein